MYPSLVPCACSPALPQHCRATAGQAVLATCGGPCAAKLLQNRLKLTLTAGPDLQPPPLALV